MSAPTMPSITPLLLSEFRFPDPELAGRVGVVMGYAVRHEGGILLFDTGFGFGSAELEATYHPVGRPVDEVLAKAGIPIGDITAVVNCHLHADHAGQNARFPGVPIFVQPVEWELAHTPDHTILEWIDFPGARYEQVAGDHEPVAGIRVVATPATRLGTSPWSSRASPARPSSQARPAIRPASGPAMPAPSRAGAAPVTRPPTIAPSTACAPSSRRRSSSDTTADDGRRDGSVRGILPGPC